MYSSDKRGQAIGAKLCRPVIRYAKAGLSPLTRRGERMGEKRSNSALPEKRDELLVGPIIVDQLLDILDGVPSLRAIKGPSVDLRSFIE